MSTFEPLFNKLYDLLKNGSADLSGVAALNEISNLMIMFLIEPRLDDFLKSKQTKDPKIRFSYLMKKHISLKKSGSDLKKSDVLESLQSDFENIMSTYSDTKLFKTMGLNEMDEESMFTSISKKKKNSYSQILYDVIREFKSAFFSDNNMSADERDEVFENLNAQELGDAFENFKEMVSKNIYGKKEKDVERPNMQCYIPQNVVQHCMNRLEPGLDETCYNANMTSGSFLHGLFNAVSEDASDKQMKKFRKNIFGFNNQNTQMMKSLFIAMLMRNMDFNFENIINNDPFTHSVPYGEDDEVYACINNIERFDTAIGMLPHGVKTTIRLKDYEGVHDNYNYWSRISTGKTLFADSTGRYLLNAINSLKVDGRFSLIINRTLLNNGNGKNSWQKRLRRWLLCSCDVTEMIFLPKGIFNNVTYDTTIIHGVKRTNFDDINEVKETKMKTKTKEIKIFLADFKDRKTKTGLTINEKPDHILNIKDIKDNDYSLKFDDYFEKKKKVKSTTSGIVCRLVEDVCNLENGKKLLQTDMKENAGKYFVIGGSTEPIGYYNRSNRPSGSILFSKTGKYAGYVNRFNTKVWASDAFSIDPKQNDLNKTYLFMYLKFMQNEFYGMRTNKTKPHFSIKDMNEMHIPIPPLDHQERIIAFLNTMVNEDYTIIERLSDEFEGLDMFKFLLTEDYDSMELVIEFVKKSIELDTKTKQFNNLRRTCCFKTVKSTFKTLNEICEFVTPDTEKTTEASEEGKYPFYHCSSEGHMFTDEPSHEDEVILVNQMDNDGRCFFQYNDGKYSVSPNVVVFKSKDDNISTKDLFTIVNLFRGQISRLYVGDNKKKMTLTSFKKVKVPLPTKKENKQIQKMISEIDREDDEYMKRLQSTRQMITDIYENIELNLEMNEEVISQTSSTNDSDHENDSENEQNSDHENNSDNEQDSDHENDSDNDQEKNTIDSDNDSDEDIDQDVQEKDSDNDSQSGNDTDSEDEPQPKKQTKGKKKPKRSSKTANNSI